MMTIIGKRRIFILLFLSVVAVAVWSLGAMYIIPASNEAKNKLSEAQGIAAEFQLQIEKLDKTAAMMKERGSEYRKVVAGGFMEEQDRLEARRKIQAIREDIGIPVMSYKIARQEDAPNSMAMQAGYVLRRSRMSFDITAYNDVDIMRFVERLRDELQGELQLQSIEIKKGGDEANMMATGLGSSSLNAMYLPKISATINFAWHTIVEAPKDQNITDGMEDGFDENI